MRFPNFQQEKKLYSQGHNFVIGCDEAGRGCLAGPVVAAAVVLPLKFKFNTDTIRTTDTLSFYSEINDSKKLGSAKRFTLEKQIRQHAVACGVGIVSPMIIDKLNIHNASLLAMQRAVNVVLKKLQTNFAQKFSHETTALLTDGKFLVPSLPDNMWQESVVRGDSTVLSIASASILAKTFRDRLMAKLDTHHPEYGFAKHKGYGTELHKAALAKYGSKKNVHRISFRIKV